MDVLVTKCCMAEPKSIYSEFSIPEYFCSACNDVDPHLEYVEMCEGCKRPARYCECP